MRLERAYLCECEEVGDSAIRCSACGNAHGLLNLATVLNRRTISAEASACLGVLADVMKETVFA